LVDGASDFGPLQSSFVARVERAQSTLADGVEACAAGRRAEARDALGRLERQMMLFRARTRTLRARKTIPRPLAQEIGDAARDIAADADALQGSLACS